MYSKSEQIAFAVVSTLALVVLVLDLLVFRVG